MEGIGSCLRNLDIVIVIFIDIDLATHVLFFFPLYLTY